MISIVIPVYNEEDVIPHLLDACERFLKTVKGYELIVVDDGSTDKTAEIARSYRKSIRSLNVVSYTPNKGLGNALRTGFAAAKGNIIVTMDGDLSHPPEKIPQLVDAIEGADVVIGSRYLQNVPSQKLLLSKVTNIVSRTLLHTPIRDITSGFRAYRTERLHTISTEERGFEVEIELIVKLIKNGSRVREIPLQHIDRHAGESKFSLRRHGVRYATVMGKIIVYSWFSGKHT